MEEEQFTKDPDRRTGSRRKKEGAGRTRSPGKGDLLKSASRAKRAEGAKLRQGKKAAPQGKAMRRSAGVANPDTIFTARTHDAADRANEDQNVGTEALNRGTEAGEEAVETAMRRAEGSAFSKRGAETKSGYSGKLGKSAREAGEKTAADPGERRWWLFRRNSMRREAEKAAWEESARNAANALGSLARRFTDRAEDLVGKLGEWILEHSEDTAAVAVLAAVIGLCAILILGSGSTGGLIANLFSGGTVASSYTAEDADIKAVEADYQELEAKLQKEISDIQKDHPGYDEYRYTLSEIGHNPYDLAAILTVLYESYTPEEVEDKLDQILDLQYELTLTPVTEKRIKTEKRTKQETRTGTGTYTMPDGTQVPVSYQYQVDVDYNVDVEYDWHVLKVTMTNRALDTILTEIGLSDDQKERYSLLKETYGNKKYLFGDDIYAISEADGTETGGTTGSAGSTYRPSGEALTDAQFAAMWKEASKYLGRAYVWGGSTPSTGFDCSGFVCWVINQSGVGSVGRTTAEGLRQWTTPIPASERKPGDIIYFQGTYNTPGASHVGIYIGDGKMIHCGDPIKVSPVDSGYFKQHFLSYGRIPQ